MMSTRPVAARARWIAASVASVPELVNRHSGSPNRRASSAATGMMSGTGWAKCVPAATRSEIAATERGMGVAGDHRAEPGVQVDVLGAIDVPHARSGTALEEHRAGWGVLPRRRDATREVVECFGVELVGAGGPGDQRRLLLRDQGVQGVTGRNRAHHGHEVELSLLTGQSERNRSRVPDPASASSLRRGRRRQRAGRTGPRRPRRWRTGPAGSRGRRCRAARPRTLTSPGGW